MPTEKRAPTVSAHNVNMTTSTRYRSVVAEEHFDVLFDGAAVRDGRIAADTLASALLALSAAAQAAHLAINPIAPRISLEIQASRPGSFSVDLLITDAISLLNTETAAALAAGGTIVTVVYGAIKGSIHLLKWLRGRKVQNVTDLGDGQTKLTDSNGQTIVVESSVYLVIQDRRFRESLREAVEPAALEGIDFVSIGREDDREIVTADDLPAFEVPDSGELLTESTRVAFLQLLNVSFQPGTKWRFTEGEAPYWAAMEDRYFAEAVERHEFEFGQGDILQATVYTRQLRQGSKLRVEHTVTKVHDVLKSAQQVELPFAETDDGDELHDLPLEEAGPDYP